MHLEPKRKLNSNYKAEIKKSFYESSIAHGWMGFL